MTTKLECCTKTGRGRLVRDALLAVGAAAYLALVLFDDVESPLISLVLILLVGYELVRPHLSRER